MLPKSLIALIAIACCCQTEAATSVFQDRDNEIRNAYQRTATSDCAGKKSCTIQYTPVPSGTRLLVSYIACLIPNSAPVGVTVKLALFSNPKMYVPFYVQGIGDSATSNEYMPINAMTHFYVNGGDVPIITLTGTSAFVGVSTCFISGETASIP